MQNTARFGRFATAENYPVWIDDALTAVARLGDVVGLITQSIGQAERWPFESWDLPLSPRLLTLLDAATQLNLARFYIGLATDQARLQ